MRIGFTGTRNVPDACVQRVQDFVGDHSIIVADELEFTTGGCVGFDALAAQWLVDNTPWSTHRVVVPANESQVDQRVVTIIANCAKFAPSAYLVERMPPGTSYRDRNIRILEHSDELVAVAEYPEDAGRSRRSGTWMTVRLARKRGIPVHLLVLSEAT